VNVLDLFSGIGGFSLGLERAGMRTVAFCEIDSYCRAVLRKHWPDVPQYDDVRTLTAERLRADGISVDVICGGFPCQDISVAGKGAGLAGERSGLWREYARLIGELRPRYVVVENVAALLGRGLDVVLGDLAALGFDAEWHCIPASAVGAPHLRDRLWIVAYADSDDDGRGQIRGSVRGRATSGESEEQRPHRKWHRGRSGHGGETSLANAVSTGRKGGAQARDNGAHWPRPRLEQLAGRGGISGRTWPAEPAVGRVANGVPARVDRLRSLGNSVVPQIPEIIGRAIMRAEGLAP